MWGSIARTTFVYFKRWQEELKTLATSVFVSAVRLRACVVVRDARALKAGRPLLASPLCCRLP